VDRSQRRELNRQLSGTSGAYELVGAPVVLALIAYAVDGWLGTRPILTILAAVIALLGAVVSLYYRYVRDMDRHDADAPWSRSRG
jgi:F0F1-type ATP synthase assembly protein I